MAAPGPGGTGDTGTDRHLKVGTRIEVRSRLDERDWSGGFEVAAVGPDGYTVRRLSDDTVLPVALPEDAVRRERHRSTWWI